ncbi:hypothetical protein [Aliarcobacter butzleri]|mgnify:FL=1|jgi:hypothetical protein|uniref:Uncharacterized protein n=6 Tax=root TaxID=1 RepID=A8ESR1_ALIB4|nr:hypothetical protein [Aliarcobacter butzleri]MCP3650069.1 hypothetical protein [Arcobacter sp. DNRA7]ABV66985.1 hypothetical protein Abu_0720 [Aliarcobacter butzleri RM4018]KLD97743.1 hypothetical protein AF74_05070 [Aliarcobacter butzleri L349]KLD99925.1 hypothetical protein AF76_09660 [Aliarcobacter butzleri L351]KLE11746.1 hypothetical protein AF80_00325 [Aliarcobacter butzleri L355]
MKEFEKYFIIDEFEDGWGMENVESEEQLYDYCTEVLFIPDDKIEELNMKDDELEIILADLESEDINDDWYVNLLKNAKESS